MQPLIRNVCLSQPAFAAFFFALIPSLIVILALCFGSIAVITWGQFLTHPLLLAMCHSLSILWVLRSKKDMWWTLKLVAAFVVLVFTHAAAASLGSYQTDFPAFSNALAGHATFTAPSTILIAVIALVAQPYLCINSPNSATQNSRHSILGLLLATTTVACVISYLTAINYIGIDRFLLSQLGLGFTALTCLWCVLSRQKSTLRYTVFLALIVSLLSATAILFAYRLEACMDTLLLTLYLLWLTGFFSIERFIGYRLPHHTQTEPQNNDPLDTKPSITRFDLG